MTTPAAPRPGTTSSASLIARLRPGRGSTRRRAEDALAAARLAGVEAGADFVDAPCGYGRHTLALARAGFRVVGVDRSKTLLGEAKRRAGHERWPKLVRADYRELPLPDESSTPLFNLFTSLGYLGDEEDTKVLAAIRLAYPAAGRQARARDDAPRPAG